MEDGLGDLLYLVAGTLVKAGAWAAYRIWKYWWLDPDVELAAADEMAYTIYREDTLTGKSNGH
jgi:hypothetical protein